MPEIFGEQPLRIHDLTVEQAPTQRFIFDPEKEFTQDDWDKEMQTIESLLNMYERTDSDYYQYIKNAADLALLFPERTAELYHPAQRDEINVLLESYERKRNVESVVPPYTDYDRLLHNIAILDPQYAHNDLATELADHYANLIDLSNDLRPPEHGRSATLFHVTLLARLLSPDRSKDLHLEEIRKPYLDILRTLLDRAFSVEDDGSYIAAVITEVSDARIIFELPYNEIPLTESEYEKAVSVFRDWHKQSIGSALHLAACLKILAAQSVHINENGVQLIMPDAAATHAPDTNIFPTQRKY